MTAVELAQLYVPPGEAGSERPVTSWQPLDVTEVLAGTLERRRPSLLRRADGHGLFYAGLSNMLFGASESCKSWVAYLAVVEALQDGYKAVIVDLESDLIEVMVRLRVLGLSDATIRTNLAYIRPDEPLRRILTGPAAPLGPTDHDLADALAEGPAVIVIDALGELFALHGLDPLSNRDAPLVTGFLRRLADRTGAAVISVDHIPHGPREGGAKAPIGAQHKRAAVTGVAFEVRATTPLAPGQIGKVSLRVNKDRPGGVREHARGEVAARISLDAATHPTRVLPSVEGPARPGQRSEALQKRMAQVADVLGHAGEDGLSLRAVRDHTGGNKDLTRDALEALVEDGNVEVRPGARNSLQHVLTHPITPVKADPNVPL